MKPICAICGKEMQFEERSMSPGSNDPCIIVVPCCIPEESADRIGYPESEEIPEIMENVVCLTDAICDFMMSVKDDDRKEQRQEILDYSTELLNRIKALQSQGLR